MQLLTAQAAPSTIRPTRIKANIQMLFPDRTGVGTFSQYGLRKEISLAGFGLHRIRVVERFFR